MRRCASARRVGERRGLKAKTRGEGVTGNKLSEPSIFPVHTVRARWVERKTYNHVCLSLLAAQVDTRCRLR